MVQEVHVQYLRELIYQRRATVAGRGIWFSVVRARERRLVSLTSPQIFLEPVEVVVGRLVAPLAVEGAL